MGYFIQEAPEVLTEIVIPRAVTLVDRQRQTEDKSVLVGEDSVVVGSDRVIYREVVGQSFSTSLYFVFVEANKINVGKLDSEESGNYNDFIPKEYAPEYNGAPVYGYIEVGAKGFGDLMRQKNAFAVTCYFETKEYFAVPASTTYTGNSLTVEDTSSFVPLNESSCFVTGRWEWSRTRSSGKYSRRQQAYKRSKIDVITPPDFSKEYSAPVLTDQNRFSRSILKDIAQQAIQPTAEVAVSRLRVRGTGRTLNMFFENEPGKGFHLLGWAAPILVNERP